MTAVPKVSRIGSDVPKVQGAAGHFSRPPIDIPQKIAKPISRTGWRQEPFLEGLMHV
jgi:hypothetical protein